MICPRCHGTRFLVVNGQRLPCPDCAGMGELHCCDGLLEQPDPTGETVAPPNGNGNGNGNGCSAGRTNNQSNPANPASGGR
jgi:hypothetical protein